MPLEKLRSLIGWRGPNRFIASCGTACQRITPGAWQPYLPEAPG